jgi:alanine dehydrogenase
VDEYGTDHEVGLAQVLLDRQRRREAGVRPPAEGDVELAQPVDVAVEDRDIGLHPDRYEGRVKTAFASKAAVAQAITEAELVIGAVLIPGASAPKLVTREMLKTMKRGSVLVDIAIDQGGCFETSRATTHDAPVFVEEGVIHYCVANMPGAVARTSTLALNNATLPFVIKLAEAGAEQAMAASEHLAHGLNVSGGKIRHPAVAEALGLPYAA